MSASPSSRGRYVALALGLLALIALVLWLRRPRPVPIPEPPLESAAESPPEPEPAPAVPDVPRAAARPEERPIALGPSPGEAPTTDAGPPRRRLLASDPDPMPAVRNPIASGSRDPFDPGDSGRRVRLMASHGAIRVGVSTTAEVRDEAQVTAIMEEMATELDRSESGRTDSFETRAHEYQALLDRYGQRLGQYMTGDFAFHGTDWILFHSAR